MAGSLSFQMNEATGHDLRAPHEFPRLLVDRDVPLSSSPRWRRVPPRRRQIKQIIEPDEWWPDENRTDVLERPTGFERADAHSGFRQIPVEGAEAWRIADRESA